MVPHYKPDKKLFLFVMVIPVWLYLGLVYTACRGQRVFFVALLVCLAYRISENPQLVSELYWWTLKFLADRDYDAFTYWHCKGLDEAACLEAYIERVWTMYQSAHRSWGSSPRYTNVTEWLEEISSSSP